MDVRKYRIVFGVHVYPYLGGDIHKNLVCVQGENVRNLCKYVIINDDNAATKNTYTLPLFTVYWIYIM